MSKLIADKIFPNVKGIHEYEVKYPERTQDNTVLTTRFGPSPTGFMHIGGLYTALVNYIVAKKSNGTFFLRIEDTDQKRLVKNGVLEIINTLNDFGIKFDEAPIDENNDKGNYGPYIQSFRKEIYQAYAKYLVEKNYAYPCFCTEADIQEIKNYQKLQKSSLIGYAGEWAKCRKLNDEEIIEKLNMGLKFAIRLKANGEIGKYKTFNDGIKGEIIMPENILDIVILKSDGLPTYHFAHVIDDHLMRTTDVIRADEWLSSLPIHVQMFEILGFKVPRYYHLSAIMKMEGNSRRKLSKRKDPEARVGYYNEVGYPQKSVIDYMLTVCSADYEDWRNENPDTDIINFPLDITKTGTSGALFDNEKLDFISKKCIGLMSHEEIKSAVLKWSSQFNKKFYNFLLNNEYYFEKSIPIWHEDRLDVRKWLDLVTFYPYMYDNDFHIDKDSIAEVIIIKKDDVILILNDYVDTFDINDDNDTWFSKIKVIAQKYNYAVQMKAYKKDPTLYNGSIVDVAAFIRYAITQKLETPDIYQIIQLLGRNTSLSRVKKLIEVLKNI